MLNPGTTYTSHSPQHWSQPSRNGKKKIEKDEHYCWTSQIGKL